MNLHRTPFDKRGDRQLACGGIENSSSWRESALRGVAAAAGYGPRVSSRARSALMSHESHGDIPARVAS